MKYNNSIKRIKSSCLSQKDISCKHRSNLDPRVPLRGPRMTNDEEDNLQLYKYWTFAFQRLEIFSKLVSDSRISKTTKKPPDWVAFSSPVVAVITSRGNCWRMVEQRMFYLASTYFLRGLPPKYRRRCIVSQPSSRWIGVVPMRHGHQDRKLSS